MELRGRNVNHVWPQAVRYLKDEGCERPSRNGPVLEAPEAVLTVYDRPYERVLFDVDRDANPFFHLFEALWILAGRDDVAWPSQFCQQLKAYSDDGNVFHGAYGARLAASGQLQRAIEVLREDPASRRAVLSIWLQSLDLGTHSKDLPCNTQLYLKIRDNLLYTTVTNRSNDIVWGLYGANAVQFSMLHEYVAARLNVGQGPLTTLSDSFHAYQQNKTWSELSGLRVIPALADPYEAALVRSWPLVDVPVVWDVELMRFLNDPLDELRPMFPKNGGCRNSFFWKVAQPMYAAWVAHKFDKTGLKVLKEASDEETPQIDWLAAAEGWLRRREQNERHPRNPAHQSGRPRRTRVGGGLREVRGQLAKKRGR